MADVRAAQRVPVLIRNIFSFSGAVIVVASLTSIILLVLVELLGSAGHAAYLGIFAYIIFPAVLAFGLCLTGVGVLVERRRRRQYAPDEIPEYPVLDLNDPRRRRRLLAFLGLTFTFVFMSTFGSYRAYEYTESVAFCGTLCHEVMKPEYNAYLASPHARVACVDCHVGPGAGWYVRSKLSGAYQVYATALDLYPRPIETPVHNLRPASETCEQCHWPQKFFGDQLTVFTHFGYDEQNSRFSARLLMKTGGADTGRSPGSGIHWHVSNTIEYASTDEDRQVIPWVSQRDADGNVVEYVARGASVTPDALDGMPKRRMDCMDCHNRPSHVYVPPDRAVDASLSTGRLDPSLPFLKREAVAALAGDYATTDQALAAIGSRLEGFYAGSYPDLYRTKRGEVDAAVAEVRRIFQTYSFPEMRTGWATHPDNLGHFYFRGCFRCHDGQHVTATGKTIRDDCALCHSVLDETSAAGTAVPPDGAFRHPVDLGALASRPCADCHKGDRGFTHPIKLGDISEFACSECHPRR
jgi:nitrate/TMAO reductase-like tetraheme cytochrome c subunit